MSVKARRIILMTLTLCGLTAATVSATPTRGDGNGRTDGNAPGNGSGRSERSDKLYNDLMRGKVAVGTRSCLWGRYADRQTTIDENTILFRVSSNRVFRTNPPGGCTGLGRDSTIIRRSISRDLCRGEIFEVRDAGTNFPRGSCTFGDFTEFRTPER